MSEVIVAVIIVGLIMLMVAGFMGLVALAGIVEQIQAMNNKTRK